MACGCDVVTNPGVRGSGVAKTETRSLEPCTQVELIGSGRLEVTIGEPGPLELTGDDNLLPLISTTVEAGRLRIKPTEKIHPETNLVFRITVADLDDVRLDGAAKIVIAKLDNKHLRVRLFGAADAVISGRTDRADFELTGAADLDASGLAAGQVSINLAGAGDADVQAIETLDVSIAGVGSVSYSGDPKVTKSISGLGVLKKK